MIIIVIVIVTYCF